MTVVVNTPVFSLSAACSWKTHKASPQLPVSGNYCPGAAQRPNVQWAHWTSGSVVNSPIYLSSVTAACASLSGHWLPVGSLNLSDFRQRHQRKKDISEQMDQCTYKRIRCKGRQAQAGRRAGRDRQASGTRQGNNP